MPVTFYLQFACAVWLAVAFIIKLFDRNMAKLFLWLGILIVVSILVYFVVYSVNHGLSGGSFFWITNSIFCATMLNFIRSQWFSDRTAKN